LRWFHGLLSESRSHFSQCFFAIEAQGIRSRKLSDEQNAARLSQRNQVYEIAAAYRPDRRELIKLDYEIIPDPPIGGGPPHSIAVQLVTTFGPLSASGN